MAFFFATTPTGLEDELAEELTQLGVKRVSASRGGVDFEGPWRDCYTANLCSRLSGRVILKVLDFPAYDEEHLYHNIRKHDFTKYISADQTLAVDATVRDSALQDQRFVAMKAKDAIVDQFREKYDKRPDVDNDDPDLVIVVRIYKNHVDVGLDTSGAALFKRGYRRGQALAPLKENFAAGLLSLTGWNRQIPIVDPMCGSGTFLIEAAQMALDICPGGQRRRFAFQRWKIFFPEIWETVLNERLAQEKEFINFKFYGYDSDRKGIGAARGNAQRAGVEDFVFFKRQSIDAFEPPPCDKGIIVANPPYGVRLGNEDDDNLKDLYRDLGFVVKNRFKGWQMWVLSGNPELPMLMGLKSAQRIPVYNGPIECRWLKYEIRD